MRPLDDVLAAFKRDWMAGGQPDIDAYAAMVPADQQDAFVDLVDTWLAVAPDVALAPGVLESRVAADPALAALAAAYDAAPGSLAELVPRLRATRNWSIADLAAAFVQRLGLPSTSTGKVGDYLVRVERGAHDSTSLSRKALDALGELLGVGAEALTRAAGPAFAAPAALLLPPASAPPASGVARFRSEGDAQGAATDLQRLADALRTPAPSEWDVVDELFCAGT
jgi:hypothetical protein